MNRQDDIFKLFRDNQHKIAEKPSSAAWRKLENRMDTRQANQKANLYKYAAVMAVLIASFAMITALSMMNKNTNLANQKTNPANTEIAETNTIQSIEEVANNKVVGNVATKDAIGIEKSATEFEKNEGKNIEALPVIDRNEASKTEVTKEIAPFFKRKENSPTDKGVLADITTASSSGASVNKPDALVEPSSPIPAPIAETVIAPSEEMDYFEVVEEEAEEEQKLIVTDITPPTKKADLSEKKKSKDFLETTTPASDHFKNQQEAKEKEEFQVRDAIGFEDSESDDIPVVSATKEPRKLKGKKSKYKAEEASGGLAAERNDYPVVSDKEVEVVASAPPPPPPSIGNANGETRSQTQVEDLKSSVDELEMYDDIDDQMNRAAININDFQWMLGQWSETNEQGTSFEQWSVKDATTLQGKGFLINNNDTSFVEHMYIKEIDNILYYMVTIDNNENVSFFRLKSFDGNSAIFENPNLDFPNQVIIEKQSVNSFSNIMQNAAPVEISTEQQQYLLNRNVLSNQRVYRNLSRSQ